MIIKVIDKKEFEGLSYQDNVYNANGCIFSDDTNNILAFPVYDSFEEEPEKYYMVLYTTEEVR